MDRSRHSQSRGRKVITSDMARQMAKGLFGEAELFEYSEELSKAEIADMIDVYEYAVTDESIKADHGADAPQTAGKVPV